MNWIRNNKNKIINCFFVFVGSVYREIKEIDCNPKKARNFGLVVGIVLVIFAFYFLLFKQINLVWLWSVGGTLIMLGIFYPNLLKYLYFIWMGLAVILGFFVSRIILILLFYFILTPMGLLTRLIGKDFLNQKIENEEDTYWIKYIKDQDKIENFEQLY